MFHPRLKLFLWWFIPLILFLALAFDGNTHWDETNYLNKGAFAPFNLSANWVHYSGGFYNGRMFHIFVLHSLFAVLGVGIVSLFIVQAVMAFCVLGAGVLFFRTLKEMALPPSLPYLSSIVFLFLPLALYLAYKGLAETTAILLTALALFLFFRGIKKEDMSGVVMLIFSAGALFLATNSRVECLLTFSTLVIPYICFQSGRRLTAIRGLLWVGLMWVVLTVILGFITGIWSLEFMLRRSEVYGAKFAADSMDYPPNYIVAVLFGGGFWFFALLSLFDWRRTEVKIAWGGLLISMVPIALLADHTELRYYNPAIFSFALVSAIGIKYFYDWLKRKQALVKARAFILCLFCLLVARNQLIRPFQEIGSEELPLIRMMHGLHADYDDPLIIMAHPHSTYAFARLCFPDSRIALDRDFEKTAPLMILDADTLAEQKGPIFYISPCGDKEKPLLIKLLNRFRGGGGKDQRKGGIPQDSWVTRSGDLKLVELGRAERYILYSVCLQDGKAAPGGGALE